MQRTNQEIEKMFSDAAFADAINMLKHMKFPPNHSQMTTLAQVVFDKAEEMDGMHGLNEVVDAAARLQLTLDACYAPPQQLTAYRSTHEPH